MIVAYSMTRECRVVLFSTIFTVGVICDNRISVLVTVQKQNINKTMIPHRRWLRFRESVTKINESLMNAKCGHSAGCSVCFGAEWHLTMQIGYMIAYSTVCFFYSSFMGKLIPSTE